MEKCSTCFHVLIDRKCFGLQEEFTYEFQKQLQKGIGGELKPTHHRKRQRLFFERAMTIEASASDLNPKLGLWVRHRTRADRWGDEVAGWTLASWILMLQFRSHLCSPSPHPPCSAHVFICSFLFSIFSILCFSLPLLLTVLFLFVHSVLSWTSPPLHVLCFSMHPPSSGFPSPTLLLTSYCISHQTLLLHHYQPLNGHY